MPLISAQDAIVRIKRLIQTNQGDPGRLQYISERLENGKNLFHSDKVYLSHKISAEVIPSIKKEPTEMEEKIMDIKRLVAFKLGDPERLHHIYQTLQKNRPLYHSDENYLQSKLNQLMELTEGKRIRKGIFENVVTRESQIENQIQQKPEPRQEHFISSTYNIPEKLEAIEDAVLSKESKKTSDLFEMLEDKAEENIEIQQEKEKLSKLKLNHEQLRIQREELSQLIEYRQKYEQRIKHEKEILEKEIQFEQEKVRQKDELVAQLIKNQSKLLQAKTEREVLQKQIEIDKAKSEKELDELQNELKLLKEEYSEIQKRFKIKNQFLDGQISEEKEKISKLNKELGDTDNQ